MKFQVFIFTIFSIFILGGCSQINPRLLGEWEGVSSTKISADFGVDGTVTLKGIGLDGQGEYSANLEEIEVDMGKMTKQLAYQLTENELVISKEGEEFQFNRKGQESEHLSGGTPAEESSSQCLYGSESPLMTNLPGKKMRLTYQIPDQDENTVTQVKTDVGTFYSECEIFYFENEEGLYLLAPSEKPTDLLQFIRENGSNLKDSAWMAIDKNAAEGEEWYVTKSKQVRGIMESKKEVVETPYQTFDHAMKISFYHEYKKNDNIEAVPYRTFYFVEGVGIVKTETFEVYKTDSGWKRENASEMVLSGLNL